MEDLHLNARIYGKPAPKKLMLSSVEQNLVIVRGLHGSGKTTYAHSLGIDSVIDLCSIYSHRQKVSRCNRQVSPDELALGRVRDMATRGRDCVVTGVFATRYHYQPYLDLARDLGIKNVIVVTMVGEFESSFTIRPSKARYLEKIFEV